MNENYYETYNTLQAYNHYALIGLFYYSNTFIQNFYPVILLLIFSSKK